MPDNSKRERKSEMPVKSLWAGKDGCQAFKKKVEKDDCKCVSDCSLVRKTMKSTVGKSKLYGK